MPDAETDENSSKDRSERPRSEERRSREHFAWHLDARSDVVERWGSLLRSIDQRSRIFSNGVCAYMTDGSKARVNCVMLEVQIGLGSSAFDRRCFYSKCPQHKIGLVGHTR